MAVASLLCASVLDALASCPDNAFDGLLCDPPYGLSFMGKRWDYDVPSVETWAACLRVLKPGAPLLAFGGSRTFHRLACGIEDAGFELRDCLTWLYGKGFPKSLNVSKALDAAAGAERPVIGEQVLTGNAAVSLKDKGGTYGVQVGTVAPKTIKLTGPATDLAKAWDGYGTALKPAWEPVILGRKPLDGTVADNVTRWGCGALAIDAGRADGGRWPANLLLDEDAAAILDAEAGEKPSTPVRANTAKGAVLPMATRTAGGYSDTGGPSRFFYCAKVSTKEREFGCEALPKKAAGECTDREDETAGLNSPRAGAGRGGGAHNHHPTLKPIALTSYLARLILPPASRPQGPPLLLVPFAGSGSEMIGATKAGWSVVGIEREPEYVAIARARLIAHLGANALAE